MRASALFIVMIALAAIISQSKADDEASETIGVFRVISNNGESTGTTWLVDKERGLLLTAAHVVHSAGCGALGEEITLRTDRLVPIGPTPKRLEVDLHATLLNWGLPKGLSEQALKTLMANNAKCPSVNDWAILEIKDAESNPARSVLAHFHEIKINPFEGRKSLLELTGNEVFRPYGFPNGHQGSPRGKTGSIELLRGKDLTQELWILSEGATGGSSGGPVIGPGTLFTAPGEQMAYGIVLHRDPIKDSTVFLPIYAILPEIAAVVPAGERIDSIIRSIFGLDLDGDDIEIMQGLTAIRSLKFYEHHQLLVENCRAILNPESVTLFLNSYYKHYWASQFLEEMLNCNPAASLPPIALYMRHLGDRTWADSNTISPLEGNLSARIADAVTLLIARNVTLETDQRTLAADLIADAVLVSAEVEGYSPETLRRRYEQILTMTRLDPELTSRRAAAITITLGQEGLQNLGVPALAWLATEITGRPPTRQDKGQGVTSYHFEYGGSPLARSFLLKQTATMDDGNMLVITALTKEDAISIDQLVDQSGAGEYLSDLNDAIRATQQTWR